MKRRKTNWIANILSRNCLLKHVIAGKIEGTGRWGRRRSSYCMILMKKKVRENGRGSTSSHSEENWLCKKQWT